MSILRQHLKIKTGRLQKWKVKSQASLKVSLKYQSVELVKGTFPRFNFFIRRRVLIFCIFTENVSFLTCLVFQLFYRKYLWSFYRNCVSYISISYFFKKYSFLRWIITDTTKYLNIRGFVQTLSNFYNKCFGWK